MSRLNPQAVGTVTPTTSAAAWLADLAIALIGLPETLLATAYHWQARLDERRQLRALDDRLLADIGLTRADVAKEVSKPFWIE